MENNKKSDILTVLENIEQMLQCYTKTVNSIAGYLQLVAIAVEAKSLATKLSLAAERWKYKLPFKEACDVDFMYWYNRIGRWLSEFCCFDLDINQEKIDYFEPKTNFFIDQYYYIKRKEIRKELGDQFRPFYMDKEGKSYNLSLMRYNVDIKSKIDEWKSKFDKADIDEIIEYLLLEDDRINNSDLAKAHNWAVDGNASKMKECFSMFVNEEFLAVNCMSYSLMQLFRAIVKANKVLICPDEKAYRSLYDRLSAAYFNKHIEDAKTSFQGWLSKTPKKRRLKMLKEKLEKEKARFFCGKWKEALEDYFDIGNELDGTDAGMFIFKYRRELTLEEVGQIVGQYHKMACILEEISRLENNVEAKPAANNAETQQETKTMELPLIFSSKVRESAKATNLLVAAIRELAATTSIIDRKLSGGKTWGHVKEALIEMGLIDNACSGAEFGRAIEAICPDKKHKNVEQVLKGYNARMKTISDGNIITEIKKMFEEVKSVNVNC